MNNTAAALHVRGERALSLLPRQRLLELLVLALGHVQFGFQRRHVRTYARCTSVPPISMWGAPAPQLCAQYLLGSVQNVTFPNHSSMHSLQKGWPQSRMDTIVCGGSDSNWSEQM